MVVSQALLPEVDDRPDIGSRSPAWTCLSSSPSSYSCWRTPLLVNSSPAPHNTFHHTVPPHTFSRQRAGGGCDLPLIAAVRSTVALAHCWATSGCLHAAPIRRGPRPPGSAVTHWRKRPPGEDGSPLRVSARQPRKPARVLAARPTRTPPEDPHEALLFQAPRVKWMPPCAGSSA